MILDDIDNLIQVTENAATTGFHLGVGARGFTDGINPFRWGNMTRAYVAGKVIPGFNHFLPSYATGLLGGRAALAGGIYAGGKAAYEKYNDAQQTDHIKNVLTGVGTVGAGIGAYKLLKKKNDSAKNSTSN